jgi:uncharacterized protein
MQIRDTLTLDGTRRTTDGYLVASVRASRTGIQDYLGAEVGKPEMRVVKVYRPADQVFNKDTLASFTSLPITVDHPPVAVTADNWRQYGVGNTGEEVARDGDTMRVSLIVKDAAAIQSIEAGKRELSCGYDCELDWTPGMTPDGLSYDAIQTNIRGNHLAIVDRARGGKELKIGDGIQMKTLVIDGHSVNLEDAAYILVEGLQKSLADAATKLVAANTQIGDLTAKVSTKDGEIAVLTKKVTDSTLTPAQIDGLVTERTKVITDAKKIFPAVVIDGKDLADIRKQAVSHKLGDAAANMDANAIGGAFSALLLGVGDGTNDQDPIRDALRTTPQTVATGDKKVTDARAEMIENLKNPKKAA